MFQVTFAELQTSPFIWTDKKIKEIVNEFFLSNPHPSPPNHPYEIPGYALMSGIPNTMTNVAMWLLYIL